MSRRSRLLTFVVLAVAASGLSALGQSAPPIAAALDRVPKDGRRTAAPQRRILGVVVSDTAMPSLDGLKVAQALMATTALSSRG